MTEIRVYFQENPLICTQGNNFTVGYINNEYVLTAIPNNDAGLLIEILEPSNAKLINNNQTVLINASNENVTLRLKLTYLGTTNYFSYVVVPPIPQVTVNDIFNRLTNLLPKNVYSLTKDTENYADNMATAQTIYQLYNNQGNNLGFNSLSTIVNNFFPSSGANGWEYFLTGNNRLLYQNTTQYGNLLQHLYSIKINNNTNPYWLTYNISKYIYLWLNKQRFVYISENIFSIENSFILDLNSLGNCILQGIPNGQVNLVIFYVLTDNPNSTLPLTLEEQEQITSFIRQICKSGVRIQVDYTKSAADLNLTYLGNTYFQDPRQSKSYCVAYNQNILDQSLGYTAHVDNLLLLNIEGFSITPATGSTLTVGNSYPIIITANPAWEGTLPLEQYIQIYSSDNSVLNTSFDGTTISFNALSAGTVTVTLYLGIKNYSNITAYQYTVI